jgi:hypothetical protein
MSNHTPGPWHASTFLVSTKPGHYDYGRLSIVQTGCHDIRDPEECIANANLISAAPDLLAACFAAIEYCDKRADEETNELWGKLSFAVRKAIGETRT